MTNVRERLRLFPDYGAETPIWSKYGMVSFDQLGISESLRAALVDWQNEGLDPAHLRAGRSEDDWEADGRVLAQRLSEETGAPVDLDV
jgi:hypothetical protein